MTTQDTPILSDGNVEVSRTMVRVGAASYPVNGITSFRTEEVKPNHSWHYKMILSGAVVALLSFAVHAFAVTFVAVAVAVLGVVLFIQARPTYRLWFATAGGQAKALEDPDPGRIARVQQAVAAAVTTRG